MDLIQVLCPSLGLPCLCNVLLFAIFVVAHLLGFAHDLSTHTGAALILNAKYMKQTEYLKLLVHPTVITKCYRVSQNILELDS